MPELRDEALRALKEHGSHVLYLAENHKRVLNHLYAHYMASGLSDAQIGEEFWRCYRHLLEGDGVDSLPIQLIDRTAVIAQIHAILRGEPITLDQDEGIKEKSDDLDRIDHDRKAERQEDRKEAPRKRKGDDDPNAGIVIHRVYRV